MQSELFNLGLRGYSAFVKNFEVKIDNARVIQVFKKSTTNH